MLNAVFSGVSALIHAVDEAKERADKLSRDFLATKAAIADRYNAL
jgi:hypothetical protein